MSVEQVKAFFEKVKEDAALAQKIKDAQVNYKGDKNDRAAAVAAIFIPIAAEAGFNFTVADFNSVFDNKDEGEASEDELDAVAGGGSTFACRSGNFYVPCDQINVAAANAFCDKYIF